MTEEYLIRKAQEGVREAQRQLYERYGGLALATAVRYVADDSMARDVVQEAFIKILTRLDRFEYRGEGSFGSWVRRIVVNESLQQLRRMSHSLPLSQVEEPLDDEDESPPAVSSVPPEVVQQLIRQLPQGYRMVFSLYVFEQMSHSEIGELLGIGENTSASQYFRARKQLARQIKEYIKQQEK